VTAFTNQVASGALTSQLISERKQLEGRVERLRTQHTEAIRDKSAAENKSRNLLDKVTTLEKEKEDLGRWLKVEKEDVENAHAEAQAARKCVVGLELEVKNMCGYREKIESATRAGVGVHAFCGCVLRPRHADCFLRQVRGGGGDPLLGVAAG
jgi:chromosome segregation ATPase